jgi:hypothetical protein
MKPDDAMDLLREAHREPIPESHFAAVRARVLSQIAAEQAVSRHRVWPLGLVAALVTAGALLLAFWPKQQARPKPMQPATELAHRLEAPAPPVSASQLPRKGPVRRAHRRMQVTGVIGPRNPTPLVVKLLTDDPNVVIYWISERTGE